MPEKAQLLAVIENAASRLPPYWPLRAFIAANPLQGLEDLSFEEAVAEGARLFGGSGYPDGTFARRALSEGAIDPFVLRDIAKRHGAGDLPERLAAGAALAPRAPDAAAAPRSRVNAATVKWLSAFLDEGQAAWPMPGREKGLWHAFLTLGQHDKDLPGRSRLAVMPKDALAALVEFTAGLSDGEREALFVAHLVALPGWASYLKWRAADRMNPWREAAPTSLSDYLALRLALAMLLDEAPMPPVSARAATADETRDGRIVLEAWEESYRTRLIDQLARAAVSRSRGADMRQAVQLVFCIDVRSEVLRRHVERSGPYETLGFAGFFGLPIAIRAFDDPEPYAACPVLLDPRHVIEERPAPGFDHLCAKAERGLQQAGAAKGLMSTLKSSVAGAFAFVEATGLGFGAAMALRTSAPTRFKELARGVKRALVPDLDLAPVIDLHRHDEGDDPQGLSPAEHLFYAEASLRIMGLTENFAPLVVLCGHGGETVNNPFAAGLDCGACAGHRGGANARVMAAILNRDEVRGGLAQRGISIPDDTIFLAGEHNTTTDELALFGTAQARARHGALLARLEGDLAQARSGANAERLARLPGDAAPEHRASDWAQVRPEWGLARNAAFIVAGRDLTRTVDLQGRSFLHSYDWRADADGKALEVILTAPMVVAEWINTQYYFSTVDPVSYGAGSKVTHNVVGGFGVVQGNGSDLMTGLPVQSVMRADGVHYHEPVRLMTVVEAPLDRVEGIIARNDILQKLFGNGWVAITVHDPETGIWQRRERSGAWIKVAEAAPARMPVPERVGRDAAPSRPHAERVPAE